VNPLIFNFRSSVNNVTLFIYLLNVIFISLIYNNPVISLGMLFTILIIAFTCNSNKYWHFFKISGAVFIVTVLFNMLINQRGTDTILKLPFVVITAQSMLNGIILGISFLNLLWSFYIYDALVNIRTVFEGLSRVFKSVAIIFILTIKFIPGIIQIFNETKLALQFRVPQRHEKRLLQRIRWLMSLTEIVLNKSLASFMNVSDTLTLRGYNQATNKLGKLEFKRIDIGLLLLMLGGILFNISMMILKIGKSNFGSAKLVVLNTKTIWMILIINCLLILLPIIMGGVSYLWWKYYISKTIASNTITAQKYR